MKHAPPIVWRRLRALCRKESFQIVRDPSSIAMGVVLPLIHNHLTEVDGDTATGSCVMETPAAPGFGQLVCQYLEDLKRVDGKWYFARRTMYLFIPYREEQPSG